MSKFKEKGKVIHVKPVNRDDTDNILTYEESNSSAFSHEIKTENDDAQYVQQIIDAIKQSEELKSNVADEVSKTNTEDTSIIDTEEAKGDVDVGKKKMKKKKRKKKKKNKIEPAAETVDGGAHGQKANAKEISAELRSQSTDTETGESDEAAALEPKTTGKKRKLPCLFGFIATWIAKRKERRREKKRKAIESRKSATPVEQLVEYEHKKSKGGVAFTVEVDSRPIRRPVLPPIKQQPGPIMLGTQEKLEMAEMKRQEKLEKKKMSAKGKDKKIAECNERKAENEFYFKQKASLTIRYKQYAAERKRERLQEDRRCSTPLLRAPSTLPPLRNVRVKPSANADKSPTTGSQQEDPVDEIFKF